MKYDADIDAESANTSHAIVVDLVGRDREVLDVGCATGYLAEVLAERGCVVTGVEVDAEAAAQARRHCREVIVADLEEGDLMSLGLERRFDVVVFADVLEHVKDPVTILRSSAELLRPGGYVVISIPNVAHGSVRLSLLAGEFSYRPLGLLDETHIRFFTRSTLRDLLASAGFSATDLRRTTAGIFATEIPVDASRVPAEVLRDLDDDADAETYQFVLSAVPVAGRQDALVARLRERDEQIEALSQRLRQIASAADLGDRSPQIGVLAGSVGGADGVRALVVEAEVRRRLDGFVVRSVDRDQWTRPATGAGGASVERALALDALVVVGTVDERVLSDVARLRAIGVAVCVFGADVADGIDEERIADLPGALTGSPVPGAPGVRWPSVPDPTVCAASVFDPGLLRERAQYLRLVGSLPTGERLLLAGLSRSAGADRDATARNLAEVASGLGLDLVVIDAPAPAGGWQVSMSEPLDVMSALHVAELVISDDPGIVGMALSFGRPVVGFDAADRSIADLANWLGETELSVSQLAAVTSALPLARARAADEVVRTRLANGLGAAFDRLAGELTAGTSRRLALTVPARLLDLQDQVNVLRSTNAGLLHRQRAERLAFGARAAELLTDSQPTVSPTDTRRLEDECRRLQAENHRLQGQLEDRDAEGRSADMLRLEAERARQELDAVLATKTFRALGPARAAYRRIRRLQ